jgi:spore coat polysaccharide biosynthesis protein SpsF
MNDNKTEQEKFWMGDFGNKYSERNIGGQLISSNIALFSKILLRTINVKSVIEFGANIGLNLIAIIT